MEFLLTYGWAILIVLAAVSALVYWDVLDPESLGIQEPEKTVYDCGNFEIRGYERTKGELTEVNIKPRGATNFTGDYLKAYYDRDTCVEQTQDSETNSSAGQ